MFDFNKPNIEITDVSEEYNARQLPEKDHAFFSPGSGDQFRKDRRRASRVQLHTGRKRRCDRDHHEPEIPVHQEYFRV